MKPPVCEIVEAKKTKDFVVFNQTATFLRQETTTHMIPFTFSELDFYQKVDFRVSFPTRLLALLWDCDVGSAAIPKCHFLTSWET